MAKLDVLFKKMVEIEASDLHLSSGAPPMFRLHGDMVPVEGLLLSEDETLRALLEITPQQNAKQFETDNDTDFAYELKGLGRFRCNLFRDHKGPGGVFRMIPAKILTVEQLGIPTSVLQFCKLSKGLVVVTGPTGSGKSTTLAAMVDYVNKTRADHVITIEDPIEFVHRNQKCLVNQREVGVHTKGFKRALRAALREDPDIVLVGELRDLETIEIAIETAETGHLVFGTLHTTTAMTTVDRIVDQFPSDRQAQIRTMLASSLKGVVAQTLLKKKPKGRVAALEVLIATKAVSALIREGKTHQLQSCMQMGAKVGMRLLNDALGELVQKGLVDPAEAYSKSIEKEAFLQQLAHIGVKLDPSQLGEPGEGGEGLSLAQAPSTHPAPSSHSGASHAGHHSGPSHGGAHGGSSHPSPSHAAPSHAHHPPAPFPSHAPTPPLPKKPAVPVDPALEEFRKKRGY
ncbi:MAG TPA: PilT/PilU family type 4a pilus ATPase [Gaiellaceae bacterium]|nr:PilT/PilU family type 4a pilus ATPase [Gaiellaceae bacterium]